MLPNMNIIHLNNGLLGYFHGHFTDKEVGTWRLQDLPMVTQLGLKLGLYELRTSTLSHYLITGGNKGRVLTGN